MDVKKIILPLVAAAIIGGGAYYGFYWLTEGQYFENTDNAYLQADEVAISPKVSGYVGELRADENQSVRKGDLLLTIKDDDFRLEVAKATAALEARRSAVATMDEQITLQEAAIHQAEANVQIAKVELDRTTEDFDRYKDLVKKGAASRQKYDYAKADRQTAQAQVAVANSTLTVEKSRLGVLKAQKTEAERAVSQAQAARDLAQQSLDDTRVYAPFDGVVGNRSVQTGALVQPGEQLLVLVPLPNVYIVANFKETQIGHMAPGQKVQVEVDAFPDADITGHVQSFAPATGSQFSLLPPENATGNFTKITQRVPVRIALDQSKWTDALRPGLSVVVDVDTRDADGSQHVAASGLVPADVSKTELSERN
ncbi:HlyD family secretion protein [Thalassospira lucentensis]|uniref:HlyD family secretion protein n=1 Tax=Thalassospira lucentensis TaxID=168935 RepID=UPI00142DB6EE|nr:HlyD family secretion protein [Thalassospira lucentensis]NIZ01322.1 HlyD family secretion protein [Thalassospira lucentensis]